MVKIKQHSELPAKYSLQFEYRLELLDSSEASLLAARLLDTSNITLRSQQYKNHFALCINLVIIQSVPVPVTVSVPVRLKQLSCSIICLSLYHLWRLMRPRSARN